jgi:hypothetical protein
MDLKKVVVLSGLAIVMMAAAQIVLAQEAVVMPTDSVTITSNQQMTLQKENEVQWAWGEVTNIDNQAQTLTLKYLDYETDQEKELVLVVDEKTTFENIEYFNELKLKDTLSIDYMTGADNKNIAKNISFEKPDDYSSVSAPEVENSQLITPPPITVQPRVEAAQPVVSSEVPVPDLAQPTVQSVIPVDPSLAANDTSAPAVQGQAQ